MRTTNASKPLNDQVEVKEDMFDNFEQTQIDTSGATIHLVKGGNGYPSVTPTWLS